MKMFDISVQLDENKNICISQEIFDEHLELPAVQQIIIAPAQVEILIFWLKELQKNVLNRI